VLHHLSAATEQPTLTQCAALLGMTHQNLKQIVLALERKQLVAMTVDAADARVRRLHLTARHRQLWKRRDPDDHSEVARWTSALSDAEVLALVALLDRLHADLAVAADEA
jgi:DNA-binding MarR family transcriptional regulator